MAGWTWREAEPNSATACVYLTPFPRATYKHASNTPNDENYPQQRPVYAGCMALGRQVVLSESVRLRDLLRNLLGR